jgi:hypothetical protein
MDNRTVDATDNSKLSIGGGNKIEGENRVGVSWGHTRDSGMPVATTVGNALR